MKVRALRRYPPPSYPTARQSEGVGGREARPVSAMSRLLGAGLLLEALLGEMAEARGDGGAAVVQAPPSPERKAPAASGQVAGLVAPALADALKHDGRGAFGCVAVSPPSFLAEDEALEVIRDECAKAGMKLQGRVVVDRVLIPDFSGQNRSREWEDWRKGIKSGKRPLAEGKYEFDLASEGLDVFIEYLSEEDYDSWMGMSASTGYEYDFPELQAQISKSLERRRADRQVVYGLFFDPLVRVELDSPELDGLDRRLRNLGQAEYVHARNTARAKLEEKAKEKLRAQVRHFLEYLKEHRQKAQP